MSEPLKLRALLATTLVLVWLVAPSATGATHRGEGVLDEVAIEMSYQQPLVAGAHGQVVARAVVDDGSPVVGIDVEFLREIDFLGPRLISLGTASTDAYGTARLTVYAEVPTMRLRAHFAGNDDYIAAEASSEISLPAAPDGPTTGAGDGGEPNLTVVAAVTMNLFLAP